MRESLFRGKSKDNGEWVYGDLIQLYDGRKFIINNEFGACIDAEGNFINTAQPFVCEVIPDTVGQYTDLTDKNDKKIFEGDIHEAPAGNMVVQYGAYWDEDADFGGYGWHFNLRGRMYGFEGNETEYVNVVGNIYDNPEIVEVNTNKR